MRNALKAILAVLVVLVLCSPLMFWPLDELELREAGLSEVTVTVPSHVLVTATLASFETSTTTTSEVSLPPFPATTTTTEPPATATIAAVGAVLADESILGSVKDPETESYDFRPVFSPISAYLTGADYAVANLVPSLAGGEFGYAGDPLLNSPESLAYALRFSGFDLVATANEHSFDLGQEGVVNTLDALDRFGLAHVGTYRSPEERKAPLVVDIQGIKVAFLNYTTALSSTGVVQKHQDYQVGILDVDQVAEDASVARTWGAEIVIAIIHWGGEADAEDQRPEEQGKLDESQRESVGELLSRGVDVILGVHARGAQSIAHIFDFESWKVADKYVAYSLGNFISPQGLANPTRGLIAYVHVVKRGLRARVAGVSYLPVYLQVSKSGSVAAYRVLPVLPGWEPQTDLELTDLDKARMAQVWEEFREMLYRPDENIVPLDPARLGL